jgi:hypothetical protein
MQVLGKRNRSSVCRFPECRYFLQYKNAEQTCFRLELERGADAMKNGCENQDLKETVYY